MNRMVVAGCVCLAVLVGADSASVRAWGQNLARGRPYALSPRPNYPHCTDAGDATQLTDGVYTKGYFWTQRTTVGWRGAQAAMVSIDLGRDEPVGAVSVNMAAGTAGVTWPTAILLFVREQSGGERFVGDLVNLSAGAGAAPPEAGYRVHRFRAEGLGAWGRFVTIVFVPSGPYVFCDEVEVHRGPARPAGREPAGEKVADLRRFVESLRVTWGVRRRIRADAEAVRKQLDGAKLDGPVRERLARELDAVVRRAATLRVPASADFRTVLPLNDLHRQVFAVQAAIWRAAHAGPAVVWGKNRWDMLSPTEPPGTGPAAIDVAVMRGEYRSAAVNVSNVSAEPLRLTLRFEGLPGGAAPAYLRVGEVQFTDTCSSVPVAAAIPDARRAGDGWAVTVPAGMTRQVWLTVHSRALPAGEYRGALRVEPAGARVPVRLKVHALTFPAETTLHLCGWDYTDGEAYDVTAANRPALIRLLREHFVNTPWAQAATMPPGGYDEAGRMVRPPDDARFRAWLRRWPGAEMYLVFASVGERFAGLKMGTSAFERAVGEWARWWSRRAGQLGVGPGRLGVLLVDEPHRSEQDRVILAWAKAIRRAAPGLVIWEDPTWREPWKAAPGLFAACDVLCPNLPMWIGGGRRFAEFYAAQQRPSRELWFYSCSGPGRLLDPYAYHRMQQWFCWRYGAKGSGFWAFGDSSGASSWNEYAASRGAYTPLFLDGRTVTTGKHMEAIREGVEDYEYLRMLRDRAAAVAAVRPGDPRLAAARALLASAAGRVTACMTDAGRIYWDRPKDRSVADRVRVEVLEMLTALARP